MVSRILTGLAILGVLAWQLYKWLLQDVMFFNVVKGCPRMIRDAVIIASFFGVLVLIDRVRRNKALGGLLVGLFFGSLLIVVISVVALTGLGELSYLRGSSYCPNCDAPRQIREFHDKDTLDVAEQRGRKFFRDELTRVEGGMTVVASPVCVADTQVALSKVLLDKAGGISDEVGVMPLEKPEEFASCSEKVRVAQDNLTEALDLATKAELQAGEDGNSDTIEALIGRIKEQQKTLVLIAKRCTPDARINFNVLGKKQTDNKAVIKLSISTDGTYTSGLSDLLEVRDSEGTSIPAQVYEVKASDSMCTLLVADNSGSIKDVSGGLNAVRTAVETLNKLRKKTDYFGLMTFGAANDINIKVPLGLDPLDPDAIDAKGGATAIWDAVSTGITHMRNCEIDKRTLVLMTDGADNSSNLLKNIPPANAVDTDTPQQKKEKKLSQIIEQLKSDAKTGGVDICVIAVGSGAKTDTIQNKALQQLAGSCGYTEIADFAGLSAQFTELFGADQNYYQVEFDADKIGVAHKVKLGLKSGNSEETIDFSNS
jgi:hypothetical protein